MTDQSVPVEETPETPTQSRFNRRKIVKATAITTAVVAGAVMLKRKLNASADGELNLTVETDNQS